MAGTKTSALAALTTLADGDLLTAVDVSDTTMAPTGTNKKITTTNATASIFARIEPTLPFTTVPGLVEGGVTDNTATINAALAALSAAGGGTQALPAGNYAIAGEVIVPEFVDLVGAGPGWAGTSANRGTRLVATNAAAKITFESSGGTSGGFIVDGADIATGSLMHREVGAERMFQSILVTRSLGEGIRIDEGQNDTWINVQSHGHTGASLVLDNGSGGNQFSGCEFSGTNDWHLIITETTGTGPYGTLGPTHNTFEHCLFEFSKTTTLDGCIDIHAGNRNVFRDCVIANGYAAGDLVRVNDDAPNGTSVSVDFDGCWFFGGATLTGIQQTAGVVRMSGNSQFQTLANAWRYDGGTAIIADWITYVGVTNRWHASSAGNLWSIVNLISRPIDMRAEAADVYAHRIAQYGDTGTRLDITPAGKFRWGPGAGSTDTGMGRSAADVVSMDTGDSFVVDGTWNGGTVRLGANRLWVDATGLVRIKGSAPASDLDGTPVGTQDDVLTSGELVPSDRYHAYGANGVALMSASQRMNLHYFTAQKTEAITQIETICGGTAAGATPTLCRVGIYSIAANGDGTLVASIVNDTALWATINTAYVRNLSATWNKVAGQRYAVAALVVTAAALPSLVGPNLVVSTLTNDGLALGPRIGGAITGQADLPASFVAATPVASRFVFTARFVP